MTDSCWLYGTQTPRAGFPWHVSERPKIISIKTAANELQRNIMLSRLPQCCGSPFKRTQPSQPLKAGRGQRGDVSQSPGSKVECTTGDRWQIPGLTFTHGACPQKAWTSKSWISPLKHGLDPISQGGKGEKVMLCFYLICYWNGWGTIWSFLLTWEEYRCFSPEMEEGKCVNLYQWCQTERFSVVQVTRWQQVPSSLSQPIILLNFAACIRNPRSVSKRLGDPCGYVWSVLKSDSMCL